MVEQGPHKAEIVGSIPTLATIAPSAMARFAEGEPSHSNLLNSQKTEPAIASNKEGAQRW